MTALISNVAFLLCLKAPTFGLNTLQTNTTGLPGSLGATGTSSLGNPFGTAPGLSGTSLTGASTFGSSLGTSTLGTTGLGASTGLTGGFGTPSLGTPSGGAFGSPGTGLGGSTFGAGTSAFSAQPKFQLQRPPAGNKRGKRRWKNGYEQHGVRTTSAWAVELTLNDHCLFLSFFSFQLLK